METIEPLIGGSDWIRTGIDADLVLGGIGEDTITTNLGETVASPDAGNIVLGDSGFVDYVAGKPMRESFDGHANCFIESGSGKGMLIDFNYDTEPLPGKYPLPGVGPFSLLQETEANHWGKLMFKWVYWNVLLAGRAMPIPALMSMAGKIREEIK